MAICEVCGNDYDKSFSVIKDGRTHMFDSFECAIQALAPTCAHCECRIIGHGVEAAGQFFCCAHCAQLYGVHGLKDRVTQVDTATRGPAAAGHEAHLRGSFDTQDLNRDGRLTFGEFMRFMNSTDAQMSAEECQIAFDEIDADHDGLVDFAQLLVWWNERPIPPEQP